MVTALFPVKWEALSFNLPIESIYDAKNVYSATRAVAGDILADFVGRHTGIL